MVTAMRVTAIFAGRGRHTQMGYVSRFFKAVVPLDGHPTGGRFLGFEPRSSPRATSDEQPNFPAWSAVGKR